MKVASLIKIKIEDLVPHEQFREDHKKEIKTQIKKDRMLKRPIVVHDLDFPNKKKYMIIDGHHRTQSLKELGYTYIIAHAIDYHEPTYKVLSWEGDKVWTKHEIIRSALRGELLKPKTTKHVVVMGGKEHPFQDNDHVEPFINFPLEELK